MDSILFSLGSLTLKEAGHHVRRTLKQSYGETYVVRNKLLPTARINFEL